METNQMERLKKQYREMPIPSALNETVEKALRQRRAPKKPGVGRIAGFSAAAAAVLFTASLNVSPALAKSFEEVPVLSSIVSVLTIEEYRVNEGNYQADIEVPAVDNLDNAALEQSLNDKYLEEGRQLYDEFMAEMEAQQAFDPNGHLQVNSGYIVKTDTDRLLAIGRYVEETAGSSMTTVRYDTIDKANQVLVTLPSLFIDDRYIETISGAIMAQMKQQMAEDSSKMYFTDEFKGIAVDQNFYINADHQLVIVFDEYEVAPGYMGAVEFAIPTEAIQSILAGDEYLK